jgi:amino acid permease
VGANSAWIISLCCFLVTFGATLAYSILLGDTFSSLAATAGAKVCRWNVLRLNKVLHTSTNVAPYANTSF